MGDNPSLVGKKLLFLGGSVHEVDLVKRARELGVYTIVTDYNDPEESPAKQFSDEYWMISWSDIDLLEKKCTETKVDGVIAGYSEFRVENMIKLCKRLDLPCYCTEQQLEITRDKALFKETCRRYHIPVVKEYGSVAAVTHFPVIVKPVDRGGSIGISVASNMDELEKAYAYAMEMSVCRQVIIEDYIVNGTKFDAYYAISGGEITLLATSDTINAQSNGCDKVIQSGWTLPSKHQNRFERYVDQAIRAFLKGIGIRDGFIFFSGFVTEGQFVFFETGFRLSGGHMYRFFKEMHYPDIQDIFIYHALTGHSIGVARDREQLDTEIKCLIINFYAKKGRLSAVSGLEEIEKMDTCGLVLPSCRVGSMCKDDKAILTKLLMVHLYGYEPSRLAKDAEKVYALYQAKDENGDDMVFDRMNTDAILDSWIK